MRKNRRRPLSSDSEEEIVLDNLKKKRVRKRVIEQYSSLEDEDSKLFELYMVHQSFLHC